MDCFTPSILMIFIDYASVFMTDSVGFQAGRETRKGISCRDLLSVQELLLCHIAELKE